MKTISYYTMDKTTWGPGPWQDEPDKKQWLDEKTGYPCLIVRSDVTGALCGYVGLTLSNKMFGKDYNDADVRVHGGLTFAGLCREGADQSHGICHTSDDHKKVWWQGFDCAHCDDATPAMDAKMKELREGPIPSLPPMDWRMKNIYRDLPYVISEVENLAEQFKKYETSSWKNRLRLPLTLLQETKTYRRLERRYRFMKLRKAAEELKVYNESKK